MSWFVYLRVDIKGMRLSEWKTRHHESGYPDYTMGYPDYCQIGAMQDTLKRIETCY